MSGYAIANYAGTILQTFHRLFPAVSVRLVTGEPAEAVPLLEQGRVDVVVSSPWVASGRVVVNAAAPIRFDLISTPRFRLRKPLTWEAVLEHPFVLADRNSVIRQAFEELLRRQNLLSRLRIAVEASTLDLATSAVRAGWGVGLVPLGPAALTKELRGLQRHRPPAGLPRVDIAVMCRRDVYMPRYQRAFVEIAAQAFRAGTANRKASSLTGAVLRQI
ncbi:MAG: substrate-binding domain-containing protein [Acidobacteria bacterium]|nr:substrate-binding domain-containing protein [Acidobacteriota bacterium]